jgi:hypothetical protein
MDSGATAVDPHISAPGPARPRRRRIRLTAATAAIALTAGISGWTFMDRGSEPTGVALPAVVLGDSLQPLALYSRNDAHQVGAEPVGTLHVRFAMIRKGPGKTNWELTLVAPDEGRSAIKTFGGRQFDVLFDGKRYPVGLSYPANFDGRTVDFFVQLPTLATASALAESVTTSVVTGPPMGGSQ